MPLDPRQLADLEEGLEDEHLLDVRAVVSGVDRRHGVGVGRGDEGVPEAQHHDLAFGTDRRAIVAVVGLRACLLGAAGPVVAGGGVAGGVIRVVARIKSCPSTAPGMPFPPVVLTRESFA